MPLKTCVEAERWLLPELQLTRPATCICIYPQDGRDPMRPEIEMDFSDGVLEKACCDCNDTLKDLFFLFSSLSAKLVIGSA